MLSSIKGAARFSWRGRALLFCLAAAALALPAVHVFRVSSAEAQDKPAAGEKPTNDPFGQQPEQDSAKDKPAADEKPTSDPFGEKPKQETAKDKPPADLKPELDLEPAPEATKPRAALVEYLPRPSENERNILEQLEMKTECDFTETPLVDVMEYLSSRHEIQVRLEKKALEEAGTSSDTPVTAQYKGVSLRSALRRILAEHGLTFVVRDEVLLITTKDKAQQWLIVRTYPVGDLVGGGEKAADFDGLLQAITATVDPDSWAESGGPGTAKVVSSVKSIVVSQTDATHDKILDLLRSLRAAKAEQETGVFHSGVPAKAKQETGGTTNEIR